MRTARATMGLVASIMLATPVAGQLMDEKVYTFVQLDQLEYRSEGPERPIGWEAMGWIGGDFTRLWVKSEGNRATVGTSTDVEVQLLYSRLFAPFWEVQFGMRLDAVADGSSTDTRVLAVFGFEGLAPYWFEVEPAVFVSQDGDVSARITSTYDVFVTQRLIAQSRVEANVAVQDVATFGVGSGLNDIELGVRLRYEARRKAAPYAGVNFARRFGETATMARLAGDGPSAWSAVAGFRLWY